MVATLAVEPVSTGTTHLQDYRYRPAMGERTVLPDSTAKAQAGAQPRNEQRQHDRRQDATPSPPARSGSSMFAAAVIAGSLPPKPQSMEELIRRIGISEIPPEAEARLKDILA